MLVQPGGVVLCGGRSTRMGTSKAQLPFGAESMLQRVVRLLGTVASPIVVVAAPDQGFPELPASVTVTRDEVGNRGPLEGLRAGLKALPAHVEVAYVTGCDVPLLVPQFVQRMVYLLDDYDASVVEFDGVAHPLSAVYRRSILPAVETLLSQNCFRLHQLLDVLRTRRVQPSEVESVDPQLLTLQNLNTPQDYSRALAAAGLSPSP